MTCVHHMFVLALLTCSDNHCPGSNQCFIPSLALENVHIKDSFRFNEHARNIPHKWIHET